MNRKIDTKTKKLIITIVLIVLVVRLLVSLLIIRPLKRAQDKYLDSAQKTVEQFSALTDIVESENKIVENDLDAYGEYMDAFDPFDYITFEFCGADKEGYVDYKVKDDPLGVVSMAYIMFDKKEGLSNGDVINATVTYIDYRKENSKSSVSREIVVSGLK